MPEKAGNSVNRLAEIVRENRIDITPAHDPETAQRIATSLISNIPTEHTGLIRVDEMGNSTEKGNRTIEVKQTKTSESFNQSVRKLIAKETQTQDQAGEKVLHLWDQLEVSAKEKLGGRSVVEAKNFAEEVEQKHTRVSKHEQALSGMMMEEIMADNTGSMVDVLGLDWQPIAIKAGLKVSEVTPDILKKNPAFKKYREEVVGKMIELSDATEAANIQGLSGTEKIKKLGEKSFYKGLWKKLTINFEFAEPEGRDARNAFNVQLKNARQLGQEQIEVLSLPTLKDAKEFQGEYNFFVDQVGQIAGNEEVLDNLSAAGEAVSSTLDGHLKAQYDTARSEAASIEEKIRQERRSTRLEQVKAGRELQKTLRESLKVLENEAKVFTARKELQSLSVEARSFGNIADKHRDVAMLAMGAMLAKQDMETDLASFNKSVEDHKLPAELSSIFSVDVAKQVDGFIRGDNDNIEAVKSFVGHLSELVNKAHKNEGGLPSTFLKLNDVNIGNASVETGFTVGYSDKAEDQMWEIRLATKAKDGKLNIDPSSPVIRLDGAAIQASFESMDVIKNQIDLAKKQVARYEADLLIPADEETRGKVEAKLLLAQSQVMTLQLSHASLEGGLITQLQTATKDGTLSAAFTELTNSQKAVAEAMFNQEFTDMVADLSKELKVPASALTTEALASIVATAEQTHLEATSIAEWFEGVDTMRENIIGEYSTELASLSVKYADLQETEKRVAAETDPELKAGFGKVVEKKRTTLQAEAKKIAKLMSKDLINQTPVSLRQGEAATFGLSAKEFKKEVAYVLKEAGFNPKKFQAPTGDLNELLIGRENMGVSGLTVAEIVRANLPFETDLQDFISKAEKALMEVDKSTAAQRLRAALDGGDVTTFMSEVNSAREKLTEGEIDRRTTLATEAAEKTRKERLATPEGMLEAIKSGEFNWEEGLEMIRSGVITRDVGYQAILEQAPADVTLEASRRVTRDVMKLVGSIPDVVEGQPDELAGRTDVVADIEFVNRATNNATADFLQTYLDRARAEKKTVVPSATIE